MTGSHSFQSTIAAWADPLRRFWSADGETPDWQTLRSHPPLMGPDILDRAADPENAALVQALMQYHQLMAGAVARSARAYAAALPDPSALSPAARRDLWFDGAEREFLAVLASDEFCDALRGLFKGAVRHWCALPDDARTAARTWLRTASDMSTQLGGFEVPVGASPKTEIWRYGGVSVARYHATADQPCRLGPVLLCHGLIGRQTMLDLQPDRSIVRRLSRAGADVYVLDWGAADRLHLDGGLDRIVGTLLPTAVGAVLQSSGAPDLTLFGICQGGTLAACHAARPDHRLNGLILGVAPIDFHAEASPEQSVMMRWLRALDPADIERLAATDATLSGAVLGQIFNHLNPIRTLRKYAVTLPSLAGDPDARETFLAMERWLADRPDLPGTVARQWLGDLYHHNRLIAGGLEICGVPVDLARIDVPVLTIAGARDHIVPPESATAIARFIPRTRYRHCMLPSGHIGAFVSRDSLERLEPALIAWLRDHTGRDLRAAGSGNCNS